MSPKLTPIRPTAQDRQRKAKETRAVVANRYLSAMSPERMKLITEECRVRGCVQAAKENGLTVSACLELRIRDIEKTLREAREMIASMQQRKAA